MDLINKLQDMLDATRAIDWVAPLALRLYLVPVFWVAGMNKVSGFDNVNGRRGEHTDGPAPFGEGRVRVGGRQCRGVVNWGDRDA